MKYRNSVHIDFITPQQGDKLKIEGYIESDTLISESETFVIQTKVDSVEVSLVDREQFNERETGLHRRAFEVIVSYDSANDMIMFLANGNRLRLHTNRFTRLASVSFAYAVFDNHLSIAIKNRKELLIRKNTRMRRFLYELRFSLRLLFYWRMEAVSRSFREKDSSPKGTIMFFVKSLAIVMETLFYLPRNTILRHIALYKRSSKKRELWIVSDRGMAAGDNGEALFRYIMSLQNVPADVYFAISKNSNDYSRIQAIGKVIDQESLKYRLYFLLADKIISSHADIETTNPFLRQINHVVGLYDFKFTFLQHGVIKDDLSSWLNRFEKNISLFVTTGEPERDSVLEYPYYYTEKEVLLSGLPRYDALENNPQRKIILAPTYRAQLLQADTNSLGVRPYDLSFKDSEYFKFYNTLMNDKKILDVMRENDVTMELYLHPNFASQLADFKVNDLVAVASYPYDYRRAFSEGSLLITDYSSVAFDFAYLRKPVIYTQFDEESFFNAHSYTRGYYSYKDNGFGPVCENYIDTINTIADSITQGMELEGVYRDRIETFFTFNDRDNCRRVYEALLSEV